MMARSTDPAVIRLRRCLRWYATAKYERLNQRPGTAAYRTASEHLAQARDAVLGARLECERRGLRVPGDTVRYANKVTKARDGGYWRVIANPDEVQWDEDQQCWI